MITSNFHPPFRKFDKDYYIFLLLSNFPLSHCTFGLLVPRPCLIPRLLWFKCKLSYWLFQGLLQLPHRIPNLDSALPYQKCCLLRKRQDCVFRCDYGCTPLHPRPQFWGGTYISLHKPSTYYRLSSINVFRILGARRQDWVLGTMEFALHRDAKLSINFCIDSGLNDCATGTHLYWQSYEEIGEIFSSLCLAINCFMNNFTR